MSKQMSTDVLVKKLKTVSNTQDSIPMLSLWIIHHKSHHKRIVETWLDILKKSKTSHRLTLLYLCNDVVQNCKRKNAPVYRESFSDVLVEAVPLLRDSTIKTNVQRVVKIWSKRGIYDSEFTDQLLAALITNQAPEKLRNKLLVEYKTSSLIDKIKTFKMFEDQVELNEHKSRALQMDVSTSDAIRKLKDKIGGETFSKEFEESATQLESFLKRYEKYIEERKILLEVLEQGTVYYHAQYHEAKIVVNAYKNFEVRINKMKNGLDKIKGRFPSVSSHPSSPSASLLDDGIDVSDADEYFDDLPSKPVAVETKHKEVSPKAVNLPTAIAAGTSNGPDNVLKLLVSGLDAGKAPDVAESPKRAAKGLVTRPGMRGASTSINTGSSNSMDGGKHTMRIIRPTAASDDNSRSFSSKEVNETNLEESPPSPTGSYERNIASPPRHQSLESRLAELLDSRVDDGASNKAARTDSDNDLDTDATVEVKQKESAEKIVGLLSGLGDLDRAPEPAEDEAKTSSLHTGPQPPVESVIFSTEFQYAKPPEVPVTVASIPPSSNQSIPVIGGLTRTVMLANDGSSTPTLDEDPYESSRYVTTASSSSFISPPRFSGDALGFLTQVMGSAIKTDRSSAASNVPLTTAPISSQPIAVTSAIYSNWPPPPLAVNTWNQTWSQGNSNSAPQVWPINQPPAPSPSPTTPILHPLVVSLPAKTEGSSAGSWSSQGGPTTPVASYAPPPAWPPVTTTGFSAANPLYSQRNATGNNSLNHAADRNTTTQSRLLAHDSKSSFFQPGTSDQRHPEAPHAKRQKWDNDYKSSFPEASGNHDNLGGAPAGSENRSGGNLITLSTQPHAAAVSMPQINNSLPLPQDRRINDTISFLQENLPVGGNQVEKPRSFSDSGVGGPPPHVTRYPPPPLPTGALVRAPVQPPIGMSANRARFRPPNIKRQNSDEFKINYGSEASGGPRPSRSPHPFQRFPHPGHATSPRERFPFSRGRYPPPPRRGEVRRHSAGSDSINLKLASLAGNGKMENPDPRPRAWPVHRPPRSRPPYFRPRMMRPPRFDGVRPHPRMRY